MGTVKWSDLLKEEKPQATTPVKWSELLKDEPVEQPAKQTQPSGMAADMAMATSPKPETIMADGSQTKPVKKSQDKTNMTFDWSGGKTSENIRTEAERISGTEDSEAQKEKQASAALDVYKKGAGSKTESSLLTFNNYKAESDKRQKGVYESIVAEKPVIEKQLNEKAQASLAANPVHQKVVETLNKEAQAEFTQLLQQGIPQEQAKAQVQESFAKKYDSNKDIQELIGVENQKMDAEFEAWKVGKIKGETKYFQDGLPKVYNDVINSKAFSELPNDDKRYTLTQMWGGIEKKLLENKKTTPKDIADAKHDFYYRAMREAAYNDENKLTPLAIKDYAAQNLPLLEKLEQQTADEYSKIANLENSIGKYNELQDIQQAKKNLQEIINLPDNAHGSFAKGFADGTSVPFASSYFEILNNVNLYDAAKKAQAGGELTEAEQQLLNTQGLLQGAESQTKASSAYNIGQSTAASLIFMSELAATGGANRGVMKGVEKMVLGDIAKKGGEEAVKASARYQLIYKPLAGILGAGAQTLANPQMYLKNTTERMLPSFQVAFSPEGDKLVSALDWSTKDLKGNSTGTGEDIGTALLKGVGTTFSDVFSESVFRALPSVTDPMKQSMLRYMTKNSEMTKRMFIGWYMAKEGLSTGGALARMRKAGFPVDGLVDEMLENFVNEGMTNLITGDARLSNVLFKEDGSLDVEKLKESAASTALMVGVLGAGGKILDRKGKTKVNVVDKNGHSSTVNISNDTISFIAKNLKGKNFAEVKNWAKQNISRIKPAERNAAMGVINGYARKPVFTNADIADSQWVKDINKEFESLPQDDVANSEVDFTHTITQTGNEPVITVEMPDGGLQVVEDLPTFVTENKEEIANGNIDITIDNATPEMQMVVNAAVNGSEQELKDSIEQYSQEAPKQPVEEVAPSPVVELSVEKQESKINKPIEPDDIKVTAIGSNDGYGVKAGEENNTYKDLRSSFTNEEKRKSESTGEPLSVTEEVGKDGSRNISIIHATSDHVGRDGVSEFKIVIPKDSKITKEQISDIISTKLRYAVGNNPLDLYKSPHKVKQVYEDIISEIKKQAAKPEAVTEGVTQNLKKDGKVETASERGQEGLLSQPQAEAPPLTSEAAKTESNVAASENVDVTTLKKGDEFYHNGEKLTFVSKEPDGRITVRTPSKTLRTSPVESFEGATIEKQADATTTPGSENKSAKENETVVAQTKAAGNVEQKGVEGTVDKGQLKTKEDAIQEQVTNEMDVRQPSKDGEGMGAGNQKPQEPAKQSEAPPSSTETGGKKEKVKFERNTEKIKELQDKLDAIGKKSIRANTFISPSDAIAATKIAIQLGYYKAADIAKLFAERAMNDYIPHIEAALKHILENEDLTDEVKLSLEGKEMRPKSILTRAHESKAAMDNETLKQKIEELGLTYDVENWKEAEAKANEFIEEVGLDNALQAVDAGLFAKDSAAPVYVYAKAIEQANALARLETDPIQRDKLFDEAKRLLDMFDVERRGEGRRISALKDIIKNSDIGYSQASVRAKGVDAKRGKELTIAEKVALDELAEKFQKALDEIEAHKAKIAEFEAAEVVRKTQEELTKSEKPKPVRDKAAIKKDLDAARAQFRKDMGQMSSGGLQALSSFSKMVKLAVEYGIKTAEDFYKEFKDDFKGRSEQEIKDAYNEINPPAEKKAKPAYEVTDKGELKLSDAFVNNIVKEGLESGDIKSGKLKPLTPEESAANAKYLVDKVHESLSEADQKKFSKRNVQDAISKYGKVRFPSEDAVKQQRSEINRDLQLASAEADLLKNKRPSKSGFQRKPPTDSQRAATKRINDLLKEFPEDAADVEKKFKTAQDKITTRLQNRIADLNRQKAAGARDVRNQNKIEYNEKNKLLEEEVAELEKILDDLVGKKTMSAEQRVNNAIKAMDALTTKYDNKIANKDFNPAPKQSIEEYAKQTGQSEKLEAAKKRLDAKREEFKKQQEAVEEKKSELEKLLEKAIEQTENINSAKEGVESTGKTKEQLKKERDITKGQIGNLVDKIIKDNIDPKSVELARKIKAKQAAVDKLTEKLSNNDLSANQRQQGVTSPELDALQKQHEDLLKELSDRRKALTYKTPEQRATEQALKNQQKTYDKLVEDIDKGRLAYEKKQSQVIETEALKAVKRANKDARELKELMREEAGIAEARRLELFKNRAKKAIQDMDKRLAKMRIEGKPHEKVKKEFALDAEAKRLNVQKEQRKFDIDQELERIRLRDRKWYDIGSETATNIVNAATAFKATADISAGGRQGAVLGAGHPKAFAKAFWHQLLSMASKSHDAKWYADLHNSDIYPVMKHHGLYIAEPNAKLSAREEQWMSNIPERIPVYGRIAAGSNRAYNAMLNSLRTQVFTDFHKAAVESGLTGKDLDAELDAVARFINHATGRGDLPKKWAGGAAVFNGIFFSPKFAMSRAQLVGTAMGMTYNSTIGKLTRKIAKEAGKEITAPEWMEQMSYNKTPLARREALRSMVSYTVAVAGILTLAAMYPDDDKENNITIEGDLRSSDALKIRVGNVRYDLGAGFIQWIVLFSRLMTMTKKEQDLKIGGNYYEGKNIDLWGEGSKQKDATGLISDFLENKQSPAFGLGKELLSGKNKNDKSFFGVELGKRGDQVDPISTLGDIPTPIWTGDLKDLYKEQGAAFGTVSSMLNITGFGVNVQDDASEDYHVLTGDAGKLMSEKQMPISKTQLQKDPKTGKMGLNIDGKFTPVSEDKLEKLNNERGAVIDEYINKNYDVLKNLSEEDFKETLTHVKGAATKIAKEQMMGIKQGSKIDELMKYKYEPK